MTRHLLDCLCVVQEFVALCYNDNKEISWEKPSINKSYEDA